MILRRIIEAKRTEVDNLKQSRPLARLKRAANDVDPTRDFTGALTGRDCTIIAEIKRRSPSKGRIRDDFDPVGIALQYEEHGASAISVLTDEQFFEGKPSYLADVKKAVGLPLLRKDFIIDPYQIYETKVLGGDALLLIARLFNEVTLKHSIELADHLGLSCLVEVHTRQDLDRALAADARIIGINNRDLTTFSTDLRTSAELSPHIPENRITVSESGIATREDIVLLMKSGIHAFLIGETLMRADNVEATMKEFLGVENKS